MTTGLVSTVIPVFNRPGMLEEAVESVLEQSWPNVEVIIVDDESTDDTWNVCQKLALRDERIRIRRVDHIGKPGLVRETGRRLARGDYIQYLDSDDLLAPDRFAKMIEALEAGNGADLAYCSTRRYTVGAAPRAVAAGRTGERHERIFPEILGERPWFTTSVLYRRKICDDAGPWSDLAFMEDVELDARMGVLGARVVHRPELLADVRDHSQGRASRQDLLERPDLLKEAVRAYSRVFGHARAAGVSAAESALGIFMLDVRLLGGRAEELHLHEEASVCARMLNEVYGSSPDLGITLAATIEPLVSEVVTGPGQPAACPVRVTNRSTLAYRDGSWPIYLSYHLMSSSGELLQHDNRRTKFEEILRPGDERIVDLKIDPVDQPGRYRLRIDLVLERITWFEAQGNQPAHVGLRVDPSAGR